MNTGQENTQIVRCTDFQIINSIMSDSTLECVYIEESSEGNISRNLVTRNYKNWGILLYDSNNIIVCNNTISDNWRGIYLQSSSKNTIANNNFINNMDKQAQCTRDDNTWNFSYPWGGNFWDDYDVKDEFSGANCTVLGPDGIGDRDFTINDKNIDGYPLMNPTGSGLQVFGVDVPWTKVVDTKPCAIAVFSDSLITNFNQTSVKTLGQINIDISGGTFSNVIVSQELLDGAFHVLVDDISQPSILNWEGTHNLINITYNEGKHNIKIEGEILAGRSTDVNNDGIVNILDITKVARDYGKVRD